MRQIHLAWFSWLTRLEVQCMRENASDPSGIRKPFVRTIHFTWNNSYNLIDIDKQIAYDGMSLNLLIKGKYSGVSVHVVDNSHVSWR